MKKGFVRVLLLMFLLAACSSPEPKEEVKEKEVDVETYLQEIKDYSDMGYYDVILNDSCDWDSLKDKEKKEVADYFIKKCDEMAAEKEIDALPVFGYTNEDKMAFNKEKVF